MYQLDMRAGLITLVTGITGSSTRIRFRFYHGLPDPRAQTTEVTILDNTDNTVAATQNCFHGITGVAFLE